ncbi:Carbonic anhydrase 6 [Halotydeus destructor]|nr:Carbonic anhydrase 6 [Halotydeus destructor]
MGHHQSPIDITSSHLVQNVSMYLKLKDYHNQVFPVMLHNNGHSVELSISDEIRPVISGPAVDNKVYQLHDVHFHWKSGSIGSEHFVNGKQYAAEIHFVHYNAAYGSFRAAKSQPDGLAVLSSFIEISSKTNRKLDPVISGLTEVDKIGSKSVLKEPLNLLNLISRDLKVFYRYKGSLTTHPCTESVTWIVFPVPIRISGDQFDHFHKIKQYEQHHTQGNVRRLQPINGRKIESSYIALSGSRN